MLIRQEKEEEFLAIYDLVKAAFQTAKVSNGDEQNFVNRLRAGGNYIPELALVAEEDGRIIGHVMLTKTFFTTGNGRQDILLLAPVSVVLERRSQGVGSSLIKEASRLAIEKGHKAIVVVGDPDYYRRFGFKSSVDYGIRNENQIPDQYVMARELTPNSLQGVSGAISFQV